MGKAIWFAYDGSFNGDWVSRYALRMASVAEPRTLRVLHVRDGLLEEAAVEKRLARLESAASEREVSLEIHRLPHGRGVARTITEAVPRGDDSVIVCGMRARESGRGLLGGTVAERLLSARHHDVLAVRVLSPGLLGAPRRVLYALSENPHGARRVTRFLPLFRPCMDELHLLTVATYPPLPQYLTRRRRSHMIASGQNRLRAAREALRPALVPGQVRFDLHVAVARDWPAEIIRHAAGVKAQLLLLGATDRTLPRRVLLGNPLELVLRGASCDVAIFRGPRDD